MAKPQSLSIPMSQIIADNAPLLSPTDSQWEQPLFSPSQESFTYAYYNLPPSPPLSDNSRSPVMAARMLKTRRDEHNGLDNDQLCLPTHQLFDFPEVARPPTPPSRSPSPSADGNRASFEGSDTSSVGNKRSASPAPCATKKRAVGERISSKDFIPPDVSGLTKREARLVKNRAAAFLSRQRKREEFECMEVRVAELEQENARLLALTHNGSGSSSSLPPQQPRSDGDKLVSEVELLKAQLAAAEERERTLSAQLATTASSQQPSIKLEATEPHFSALSSPPRPSTTVASAHKSGASFGLMVLLCALPSLLSMRSMQSTSAPTTFAIPNPFPASSSSASSAFDYNNGLMSSSDYDWSKSSSSLMDVDGAAGHRQYGHQRITSRAMRKLEFTGIENSSEMGALGDLDISFDTSPSDDGKIRVRIHPSSSASSRAGSESPTSEGMDMHTGSPTSSTSSSSLAMWSGVPPTSSSSSVPSMQTSFSSQSTSTSFSTSSSDPFLGFSMPFAHDGSMSSMYGNMGMDMGDFTSPLNYGYGQLSSSTSSVSASSPTSPHDSFGSVGLGSSSEYSIPDSSCSSGKRRVRIALKSMPQAGGEGGEWEVQIC